MPCGYEPVDYSWLYKEAANAETRAACDMRTILKRLTLNRSLIY